MTRAVMRAGIVKANMSWYQIAVRAFLAGCYVAFGALFAIMVGWGLPGIRAANVGLQRFMFAIVFPSGLVLIVLSGAELFTGNCMFLMPGLLSRKITLKDLAKNWGISYLGNFAGCLFVMGILVYLSGISSPEPYNSMIIETSTLLSSHMAVVLFR